MTPTRSTVRCLVQWVGPALVFSLFSCAYYNTFYVAKKSYNAAEKSVASSETDRLPADARRNYEQTIQQCKKVLLRHKGSRWADDALYLMAASYHGIAEYDSALLRLDQLAVEYPQSGFRADGRFLEGLTYTSLREYEKAEERFDAVVEEFPKYERRDEILFVRAETAGTQRKRTEAIRFYDQLVHDFPKSRFTEEALKNGGELQFEEGNYDSASIYFDRLLSIVRDEEAEIEAAVLQAQCLIRLDRAEEALDLLEKVEPKEASTDAGGTARRRGGLAEDVGRIRLQQAAALNRLGRHTDAIETLQDVTTRYASSGFAVEAQFQIGYTYETLLDSLSAARAAYEKASAMPGRSIFKQQAAQRAVALKSIAELQQQEGSGDSALEARADAALRIAEILLLDREMIPEASAKYREVEEQFPESRAAPRAAYALAYIRWKLEGDSLGAQEAFRRLVPQYPASTQARDAIELLALQGADTSGLGSLLVALVPETSVVAVDSLSGGLPPGVDSLAAGPGAPTDSLTAGPVSALDSLAQSRLVDSLRIATPLDSLAQSRLVDSLRITTPLDSLPQSRLVDSLRITTPLDSLAQSRLVDSLRIATPLDSLHESPSPEDSMSSPIRRLIDEPEVVPDHREEPTPPREPEPGRKTP